MRVAVVGLGALGSVYAALLARAGCRLDLVGRVPGPARQVRLEQIDDGDAIDWAAGPQGDRAPPEAEIALVCVRYEHLDQLGDRLGPGDAPIVVLTPMLPLDHARLSRQFPGRVLTGMPSVIAYRNTAGAVRYWLPRGATTFVEARAPAGTEVELVAQLSRAGIRAQLERDVLARNVATTVSFMPMAMAIDAAGGIDAALGDASLLSLAIEATHEGCELGRAVGRAEAWASILLKFVRPFTLKAGVALAKSRAPEAVRYVEQHFGRKLHAQNLAMGARMTELARERRTPSAALERLLERLRGV